MPSLNKVILIGHLTGDPELKETDKGLHVTNFSIGVGRRFQKDTTDFINIVAWKNTAEFITKYFRKGQAICVCGSIQTRSWTDKSGAKRTAFEVVADEASFAEKRSLEPTDEERNAPSAPNFEEIDVNGDDLPF